MGPGRARQAGAVMRASLLIILIAMDHLFFALITLGNCVRGETMSAAAWRLEAKGKWQGRLTRPFIDWLFTWIEREHCWTSWEAEKYLRDKT